MDITGEFFLETQPLQISQCICTYSVLAFTQQFYHIAPQGIFILVQEMINLKMIQKYHINEPATLSLL